MQKTYDIVFKYTDDEGEIRKFCAQRIRAENRQKAFDLAILELTKTIVLVKGFENGKQFY